MAVNKPTGDNARKGVVKKRSQLETTLGGARAWTKRNRTSGDCRQETGKEPKGREKI